jgi:putative addiction module component (TIGR02574 family)
MAANLEQLGLDRLSRSERLDLVFQLWDSIADESGGVFLSNHQRAELIRRIAEDDADLDGGIPWEQVKANARQRNEK